MSTAKYKTVQVSTELHRQLDDFATKKSKELGIKVSMSNIVQMGINALEQTAENVVANELAK